MDRGKTTWEIINKYIIIKYIKKVYVIKRIYYIYNIIVRTKGTRYKTFGIPKINLSTLFYMQFSAYSNAFEYFCAHS